jgi:hypothetical protein
MACYASDPCARHLGTSAGTKNRVVVRAKPYGVASYRLLALATQRPNSTHALILSEHIKMVLVLLFVFLCCCVPKSLAVNDTDLLLQWHAALQQVNNASYLPLWNTSTNLCNWTAVSCYADNTYTINLSAGRAKLNGAC